MIIIGLVIGNGKLFSGFFVKEPTKVLVETTTNQPTKAVELTPTAEPTREPVVTPVIEPTKTSVKTIYLTFDDGPSKLTLKNLETLKKENIKATFFVLPHQGVDGIYKKIVAEGHVVGSHSFAHLSNKEIFLNSDAFEKDLSTSLKYLKEKTGVEPLVYRCPGGAFWRNKNFNSRFNASLNKYNMRAFDWTVSSCDTDGNFLRKNKNNPEVIIQKFKNNIVIGIEHTKMTNVIVLMHDTQDKIYTAEAIKLAIPELIAKGYTFSTLDKFPEDGIYR